MGIDCRIITEKGSEWLDRLYVFDDYIEPGKIYTAIDFTQIIGEVVEQKAPANSDYDSYEVHWLKKALEIAARVEWVVVVSENDSAWDGVKNLHSWKRLKGGR